jgi:ketosteroid isomerase-like protein
MKGELMDDITTFLDAWTDAERAGDAVALDHMLTDDFVGVGPLGFMLPKPAWLARHQTGDLQYETFSLEEMNTRVHGDSAVITARHTAKGAYAGHPIPEAVRATLVLVREGDTRQLAGIQFSFIAGTPGAPPVPGG